MKEFIASFIDQKELSENSQSAYFYDLDQFIESIHGKVTPTNLRIYQASIKDFKPAVQKRKLSAVNQFHDRELMDLTHFWEESTNPQGRLMALLILEMGLLPSEILQVKVADIQMDFHVIRVGKNGQKRVLKVPEPLLDELQVFLDGVYLFDNKGKSYSRQWGFRQLEAFLIEKGHQDLSAQSIREQYILKQRELGVDLFSIARELGLKTMVTLEKYK